MALPRRGSNNKLLRHRLRDIKLEPPTSKYDITVEILVDDKKVHELPEVKKGQPLCWRGLSLPCDVYKTSAIAILITEVHTLRNKRDSAVYQVSQAKGQDALSIECVSKRCTVNLSFLDGKAAEQAYRDAFRKAQEMGTQPSVIERAGRAGDAFKTLLELGSVMAEASTDPTKGAKIAFTICTKAWMHLEEQDQRNKDLNKLVEDLASMIPSVDSIKCLADANLRETVVAMLNLIEDVSLFILSFDSRSVRAQIGSFVVPGSDIQDQIVSFSSNFKSLREDFDTRVSVQTLGTIQAENIRSRLRPVDLADYDITRACLPDTRVAIIRDITTWNTGQRLAWVHGLAGLGKSSIATSVCQQLDQQGELAASFFCKRDNPELRDPRRVLTSIAYSLSLRWKSYGEAVAAIVDEDPKLCSQHIQPLCDTLLVKPLQVAAESNPPDRVLTVVVDALDECGSADTRTQLITCFYNVSQATSWLRVLVTSRPDVDIQDCFAQLDAESFARYNVLSYDAFPDIRVFIRTQLGNIEHSISDWPKDSVDKLSEHSSGLFQWAQTACRFITEGHDPRQRLEQVLAGARLADSSIQLDALYTTAIKVCAMGDNLVHVKRCLGVVVATATRTPLSVPSLSKLLCGRIPQYTLDHVLHGLSSVLYFDYKHDNAVRISHPSFMDYVTDQSRSKELWVDLDEQNAMLAECCLETMTKELRFNMCDLETSHMRNRDVPNLDKRVQNVIGTHLSYSCIYWANHMVNTQRDMPQDSLQAFFFGTGMLYWIEALSLLGKLSLVPPSLLELIRVSNVTDDFRSYAHDAYRFVLSFYDAISESTPHLYVSALALAPAKSKVAERMRKQFPNMLVIGEGGEQEWTSCLRTIWTQNEINTVVFSPDGYRVVSGSTDRTVRVWDAETGAALLEPLCGHSGQVYSVAFSPNSRRIVSGSADRTVRVWDAETGQALLDPLRGHSGEVNSVAFSPNNRRIASGSSDMTVRVWDAETGATIFESLRGHSGVALSVAFSPDGHRIASGSSDMNVRVWNADTGTALLRPLSGHLSHVYSVAFSPDSHRIASGSRDKTVRVWDAETGAALIRGRRGHAGSVRSVAFSPNGLCIVSCAEDCTVRVWSAQAGAVLYEPLQGHLDRVRSVAFSPDSRRIASGSYDKSVRIWDTKMAKSTLNPIHGHSDRVCSVAFSPDSRWIVSGSEDKALRIWDAASGAALLGPLRGHSGWVCSVAFSADGRRVISGSSDGTVRTWDAKTGAALLKPLQSHSSEVYSVAFSSDGRRFVSGSEGRTVRVWDAESGAALLKALRGHTDRVYSVAFSPDDRRIVSGSGDSTVRIWDAETGAPLLEPLQGHSGAVYSVAFFSNGCRIVSSSEDKTLRVWDTETGAALLEPLLGHTRGVYSVGCSRDGRYIVSGSADCTVRVWDAETGLTVLGPLQGHSDGVNSVAFSPDGHRIASGSEDNTIRVWSATICAESNAYNQSLLPGTNVPALPAFANSLPVWTSSLLARRIDSEGWVTMADGKLFLWLPPELRQVDDSSICISTTPSRRRMVMEFSKFVHGSSWSLIQGG